jgi:8-oxo-dGTP pyrophosphatase MutT (NUDIX family)
MQRTVRCQGAILRDHHILLLKQTDHSDGRSYWQIPGGGIEPDESEEECVIREMWEETSLRVRVESLLLDEPAAPGEIYQRRKTYRCAVVSGEASPGYEPEPAFATRYTFTAVGWFDLRAPESWPALVREDPITDPLLQRLRVALGYASDTSLEDGARAS